MTGRVERQLDSEAELAAALRELAGAGASAISIDLDESPAPSSGSNAVQPPSRQIDPASQSISLVDARRPDRPIIYVNRGFEHLTGYTREECIGRNCRFLQGPDTDRAVVDRIRHATRAGEDLIVDLLNYRKNGTTFWNRLSLKPVRNAAADLTHIIGIQSDITPMIALQDQVVSWAIDLGRS
ncbi:MAG: PAS domain-containing protein [Pseudomonas sp.]|nr:PAS domain-containing protein [Pseudomonas sp.]